MADARTNNFNFTIQVTGTNTGTWGDNVSNNVFTPLDAILGGTQPITMTNADVNLSLSQWQNKAFKITGTLVANVNLILPLSPNSIGSATGVGGNFIVDNETTGGFSITVKTAATSSTGVTVPQGARVSLYSDTVNVWYASDGTGIPFGAVMDFAGSAAPSGWLLCFGQSVLRAQYPALFTALGSGAIYGVADGTHFNIPDYRGRVTAGKDDMGGSAANRIGSVVTDNGTITGTTLGSNGGSSTHTQTGGETGSHSHGTTEAAHTHNVGQTNLVTGSLSPGGTVLAEGSLSASGHVNANIGTATTGLTVNASSAPAAMAWLQPTMITNKIIYAGA